MYDMPISSPKDVLAKLKAGRIEPLYLLLGDDEVGKTPLVEAFEAVVPEDVRGLDVQKFYATDSRFDLRDVVAAARTLPFLGGTRIVQLFRAERFLKPKNRQTTDTASDEADSEPERAALDEDADQQQALAEFSAYLEKPSAETCLVLVAEDLHRGTRLGRLVLQHATVVEFWGLAASPDVRERGGDAALERAERYVRGRVAAAQQSIDDEAVERIVAHAGADLAVLRGDVERVLTYTAGRREIAPEDV
jgi:DNA polymerase III delta subunit